MILSSHHSAITSISNSREERRIRKWRKMIGVGGSDWKHYVRRKPHVVKRRIRKGIPDCLRGLVWQLISGSRDLLLTNPGVYEVKNVIVYANYMWEGSFFFCTFDTDFNSSQRKINKLMCAIILMTALIFHPKIKLYFIGILMSLNIFGTLIWVDSVSAQGSQLLLIQHPWICYYAI